MRTHVYDILEVLDRRRYARSNFFTNVLGGSLPNRRRDLAHLTKQKLIRRLNPAGDGDVRRSYPQFFFRIYTKHDLSTDKEHTTLFWHQVMIDDLMLALEAECRKAELRFRHRDEILAGKPFMLPASITHPKTHEVYTKPLVPDELFAIEDTHFVLKADRHTERISLTLANLRSARETAFAG